MHRTRTHAHPALTFAERHGLARVAVPEGRGVSGRYGGTNCGFSKAGSPGSGAAQGFLEFSSAPGGLPTSSWRKFDRLVCQMGLELRC